MTRRKSFEQSQHQDIHREFQFAYLVVSAGMLLCELALLAVLLWRHPSLTQAQVFLFVLVSGVVAMPLFLGLVAHSARTPSLKDEKEDDQQKG